MSNLKSNLTFGDAVIALKQGKRVQRSGWNGAGLFAFMQVPANIPISVIPTMQSLPQAVKDEFVRRADKPDFDIRYRNQLALVYPDSTIYGWSPSGSDALAVDWIIMD